MRTMLDGKAVRGKKKVVVGLSGGVDSSVAAFLLKERGYEVTGVFMKCWGSSNDGCGADEDKSYALKTAAFLDIPFKVLDFQDRYKKTVIDYFYSEYKAGRTPNPDVMCNKEIKFGLFFDWAMEEGFDYVATGHYAGISEEAGMFKLLKAKDASKDQSYFLYHLGQKQLGKTLFPLAELLKMQVRDLAEKQSLPAAKRRESMGICFIGEVDIKKFLMERFAKENGDVLDTAGNLIGMHDGAWFYTIGQRHGFSLNKYFGEPLYVLSKNVDTNTLIVGKRSESLKNEFSVEDLSWVSSNPLEEGKILNCAVRIRHLGDIVPSELTPLKGGGEVKVRLSSSVFGVAPGQSAVFYKDREVLGGGIIL